MCIRDRPGEATRITPVKDVIEPRVKVSGGEIFPGIIGKVSPQVGSGRTHALDGCCVVTVGRIVGFQEGVIDMSGPAAEYCPFSKTYNLCVVIEQMCIRDSSSYCSALQALCYIH